MKDPTSEFWEDFREQEKEDLAIVEKELIPAMVKMIADKNLLIKVVDKIPAKLSRALELEKEGVTLTQRFKIVIPR